MGSTALLLVKLFAPNAEQMYLVNHLKDSPAEEKRNVLEENARRAHGDIQDLADLNSSKPEAVIIPVLSRSRKNQKLRIPPLEGSHSHQGRSEEAQLASNR
ncbi:glyoxalase ElbB-like isoform X2 [Mirounga angustirostris]